MMEAKERSWERNAWLCRFGT